MAPSRTRARNIALKYDTFSYFSYCAPARAPQIRNNAFTSQKDILALTRWNVSTCIFGGEKHLKTRRFRDSYTPPCSSHRTGWCQNLTLFILPLQKCDVATTEISVLVNWRHISNVTIWMAIVFIPIAFFPGRISGVFLSVMSFFIVGVKEL